ncbi:hypothetical protein D3C71_1952500 [compost metagenome]
MVVDEDQRRSRQFQRAPDDFARIDRRMVHRPHLLHFVGNQAVLLVEKENAKLLDALICHGAAAVVDKLRP